MVVVDNRNSAMNATSMDIELININVHLTALQDRLLELTELLEVTIHHSYSLCTLYTIVFDVVYRSPTKVVCMEMHLKWQLI